jgi:hypothetical protein
MAWASDWLVYGLVKVTHIPATKFEPEKVLEKEPASEERHFFSHRFLALSLGPLFLGKNKFLFVTILQAFIFAS